MLQSVDMGRPKTYNYPPNMTFDRSSERWIVRNPIAKKVRKFSDETQARAAADALNAWLECERQARALEIGRPTIAGLVDRWTADKVQFMPWDAGTRSNAMAKMRRIARELGARSVERTDCMFLEEWLTSFCKTADTFNDWRYMLALLWRFAISRKLAYTNEPEKIEPRSTSKKLEMNQKKRGQLDLDAFKAIHEKAPAWLQLAMDVSLVTLQSRLEVCSMQHAHFRDGFLFVIRDKVSGDSDMAFIKIEVTPQIEEFRTRSRALDSTVSPYIVHRQPDSQRREWIDNKPHWTYLMPDYLSKGFAEARDQLPQYAATPARERPTFHEIRGLGARLYRARGVGENAIQALMTHAHQRTTQIYLDRGAAALTSDDYTTVSASMTLSELGIKG